LLLVICFRRTTNSKYCMRKKKLEWIKPMPEWSFSAFLLSCRFSILYTSSFRSSVIFIVLHLKWSFWRYENLYSPDWNPVAKERKNLTNLTTKTCKVCTKLRCEQCRPIRIQWQRLFTRILSLYCKQTTSK